MSLRGGHFYEGEQQPAWNWRRDLCVPHQTFNKSRLLPRCKNTLPCTTYRGLTMLFGLGLNNVEYHTYTHK